MLIEDLSISVKWSGVFCSRGSRISFKITPITEHMVKLGTKYPQKAAGLKPFLSFSLRSRQASSSLLCCQQTWGFYRDVTLQPHTALSTEPKYVLMAKGLNLLPCIGYSTELTIL